MKVNQRAMLRVKKPQMFVFIESSTLRNYFLENRSLDLFTRIFTAVSFILVKNQVK